MVDIWSTKQYNILCIICMNFLLWENFFYKYSTRNTCNIYQLSSCVSLFCWKVPIKKFWLISLSVHNDTVIVPKIRGFPVLVWETLPFHCYFGQFFWLFGIFPSLSRSEPFLIPNPMNIRGIPRQRQWILLYPVTEIDNKANEFPKYSGFSQEKIHIYTQISLIVPNIQNPHRDTAETLKIHELGLRLLSNPNKCGYWL